jgi:hypothetical protein
MQHSKLIEKITQLGLAGFKEAYARQSEDINYHTQSFEERLYQLLDAQSIFVKNKQIITPLTKHLNNQAA